MCCKRSDSLGVCIPVQLSLSRLSSVAGRVRARVIGGQRAAWNCHALLVRELTHGHGGRGGARMSAAAQRLELCVVAACGEAQECWAVRIRRGIGRTTVRSLAAKVQAPCHRRVEERGR